MMVAPSITAGGAVSMAGSLLSVIQVRLLKPRAPVPNAPIAGRLRYRWVPASGAAPPGGTPWPRSLSSSAATRRSCWSKSAFAALGLHRPRMKNTRTRKTSCPAMHTRHHRFHSLPDAFWAGITFFSTRRSEASCGELAPHAGDLGVRDGAPCLDVGRQRREGEQTLDLELERGGHRPHGGHHVVGASVVLKQRPQGLAGTVGLHLSKRGDDRCRRGRRMCSSRPRGHTAGRPGMSGGSSPPPGCPPEWWTW